MALRLIYLVLLEFLGWIVLQPVRIWLVLRRSLALDPVSAEIGVTAPHR